MWQIPFAPEQASTFAGEVDAFYLVLWALTIVFTVAVGFLILFFTIKYRRGSRADRSGPVDEHLLVEITWSAIPLVLGLGVFVWGTKIYVQIYNPPNDSREIFVIGKQWMWHIQHANGIRENNELHVPVGEQIRLTMISQDVIHSFGIPAFRITRDVIPGRYSNAWFQATKPGKYHLFCREFCGTQHSLMGGWVYVMEPRDFQNWLATGGNRPASEGQGLGAGPNVTMESRGAALYEQNNCNNCHGAGAVARGPSLVGLYGTRRRLEGGQVAVADAAYLRESILNPSERVTGGYSPTMPTYKGQLSEDEVLQLIAYIKSLKPSPQVPANGAAAGTQGAGTQRANTQGAGRQAQTASPLGQRAAAPSGGNAADTDNIQAQFLGSQGESRARGAGSAAGAAGNAANTTNIQADNLGSTGE